MKQIYTAFCLFIVLIFHSFCAFAQEGIAAKSGFSNFLGQPMNQSLAKYADQVVKEGHRLLAHFDGGILYEGTVCGVPETSIMIYDADNHRAVGSVAFMFPEGLHFGDKSDYTILRERLVGIYGTPYLETYGDEAQCTWMFPDVSIMLMHSDNGALVIFTNNRAKEMPEEEELSLAEETNPEPLKEEFVMEEETTYILGLKHYTEQYEASGNTDRDALEMMMACCMYLGDRYHQKGWYTTAQNYNQQALTYIEKLQGKNNAAYIGLLFNMSVVYFEMGDWTSGISCMEQSLASAEMVYQDSKRDYFRLLRGAALMYTQSSRFPEAEAMNERILAEIDILPEDERDEVLLTTLHDIASLEMEMGNYPAAKRAIDKAYDKLQNLYAEPASQYVVHYSAAAMWWLHEMDYPKAIEMLQKSLANTIAVKEERARKMYEASNFDNLGVCYAYEDNLDSAMMYAQKAVRLYRETYTEDHPMYARSLINLAYVHSKYGEHTISLDYNQQALEIFKKALGEENPSVMMTAFNIGCDYNHMLDDNAAEREFRKAMSLAKQCYRSALDYMSESQREQYWMQTRRILDHPEIPQFIYRTYQTRPSAVEMAYDNELFGKGLLLASTEMVRRSIHQSGDSALSAEYDELVYLKDRIAHMQQESKESVELDSCRRKADLLEKSITKRSAAFRQNADLWNLGWRDVRDHLTDSRLAIEFTRLPLAEDTVLYAALLLTKNARIPQMVPLFEEHELSDILDNSTPDEQYDYAKQGENLFNLIWDKLLPYLHFGDTIYYAPTGLLHNVAAETLPFDEESLVSEMLHVVRLSSTRELALPRDSAQGHSAALFGGIYYDMEMEEMAAQSGTADKTVAATRTLMNAPSRGGVRYLPGTRKEVDNINEILIPNDIYPQVYTSTTANEESFKALSGKQNSIIHIATHGFYWTDSTARAQRYFARQSIVAGKAPAAIDPLQRSGLLFAGANIALRGHSKKLPAYVQDGILTAKEISLLDLRGAELVILSACETGKGEISTEGVFGLQRAFKMAGAQSILMALWPVSDEATQLMMTEFYKHWIAEKMSKRDAFLNAQKTVREQYPEPRYWASFILLD